MPEISQDTDDLASLPDLNEAIILKELKHRYAKDKIYVSFFITFQSKIFTKHILPLFKTYIGDILLAINPFKKLPIYTNEVIKINTNEF